MRNSIYTLFVLVAVLLSVACNDYETYGELKEKERDNISQFISDSGYVVILEAQFHAGLLPADKIAHVERLMNTPYTHHP